MEEITRIARELSQLLRSGAVKLELLEDDGTVSKVAYNGYYINSSKKVVVKIALDS